MYFQPHYPFGFPDLKITFISLFLTTHLYLGDLWFGVDARTNSTKKSVQERMDRNSQLR